MQIFFKFKKIGNLFEIKSRDEKLTFYLKEIPSILVHVLNRVRIKTPESNSEEFVQNHVHFLLSLHILIIYYRKISFIGNKKI